MADQFNTLDLSCCDVAATKQQFAVSGRNPDVDSGTDEDVWNQGGDYPFQAVDAATEIVSDDANDAAAGTGAQALRVTGLSGGLIVSETVATNGLTPVALSNQYNRIFSTEVTAAGSGGENAGTILVQQTAGPLVLGAVLPGAGNVLNGIFTIPDNWGSTTLLSLSASLGKQATSFLSFILQFRRPGGGWTIGVVFDLNSQGSGVVNFPVIGESSTLILTSGFDIRARTLGANTANNGITVNMTFREV